MRVQWLGAVLVGLALQSTAFSDTMTVDQGSPGAQGPWRTTPGACLNPVHKVVSVGTSATACPATTLSGRRWVQICNSVENASTPKIKIRIDGTNPVMGIANPGDSLGVGDCASYAVTASTVINCIADTAATGVSVLECR